MGGLILLFVIGLWLAFVIWLSITITKKLPIAWWRIPVGILVFAVLLPLPALDEIVGGRQFEKLCKENSTIQVDRVTAVGRTVYAAAAQTPDVEIKGTWVRVTLKPRRFVDATTGEVVVSYNRLQAVGGRFLKISEGHVPLTFNGTCDPGDQYTMEKLFKELKITLIRRPEKINGEPK